MGFAIIVPFLLHVSFSFILNLSWPLAGSPSSLYMWLSLARAGHGEQFSGNRPISAQLADCHECCGLRHPTLEEVHQLRFPGRKEQGLESVISGKAILPSSRENMLMLDASLEIIPQSIPVQWRSIENESESLRKSCLQDKWEKCCEKCGKDGIQLGITCSIQHHDAHCSRLTKQAGSWFLLGRTPEPNLV